MISKLASSSLLPTMEQSPTAKQRSPFQLGNPALSLSLSLPISGPVPGQGPTTVSLTSTLVLSRAIAEGPTCVSRVKNAETELGAASPPQEWPNLYFCLLWKNFPGSLEEVLGRKVKLIDRPV